MTEIRSESEYRSRFPDQYGQSPQQSRALDAALDVRKFEIDLYWKRASYFWTLIAASFVAYFALQSSASPSARSLTPLVACVGFLLSLGWYLVNRGSKYWQENWDRHVDLLESKTIGPLYKMRISRDEFSLPKLWEGYPYSVTKVNQLISLFVTLVWFGLVMGAMLSKIPRLSHFIEMWPWLLAGLTLIFGVLLPTLGRGGSEGRPRRINFRESSLESTKAKEEPAKLTAPNEEETTPVRKSSAKV